MHNFNFAGKITYFFLKNKPLTLILLIATIVAGTLAYAVLPKQYNPQITLPAFQVSIEYPGATAAEVEQFITKELEEKIADIPGVDTISSRSIDGGISIVTVEFLIGEDLEESKTKLISKIQENLDLQSGSIRTPLIKNMNPDDVPIVTIGFTSSTLPQNKVRTQVVDIMNEMKKIPGIANLEVHGGEKRALRILLDPAALTVRKVSVSEVKKAIEASNMKYPSGFIKKGENTHEIEVNGTLLDAESARKILVLPGIQLGDIAKVEDGYSEKISFIQVMQKDSGVRGTPESRDSIFLSFAKVAGENAIVVANQALSQLDTLMSQYPELQYEVFQNEGNTAQKAIQGLGSNLIQSIIIVSIILLLFLGWRSALVVAIAIPLTLALVFLVALFFDQNINRITLFALILSLGLLVDSATVVVENIYRHLQMGQSKIIAISKAVDEIGMGLFLSTLTSVIVFLPMSQISGMMGAYMGPLSFFVPMALIMSLLIAYVLTPFLADLFLPMPKEYESHPADESTVRNKKDFFDRLSDSFAQLLSKILKNPKRQKKILVWSLLLFLGSMTFPILELVHFRMLPKADKEQYYIYIDAPEGTDSPATYKIAQKVSQIVLEDQNTKSVQIFSGEAPVIDFNGLYKGAHMRKAPYLATLRVNLSDPEERDIKSEKIVENMREQIANGIQADLVHIRLVEDPPGPPVMATLLAKVKGPNTEIREQIASDMAERFSRTKDVVDIDTSIEHPAPKTIYQIDHEKALASGISTWQVAESLEAALSPVRVSQYHVQDQNEMAFIELQFNKENRDSIQDLSQISVKNAYGTMVPLDAITKKQEGRNSLVLYKDEREAVSYVSAELGDRSVVYAVIDLIADLVKNTPETLKEAKRNWNLFGFTYALSNGEEYQIEWGGEWKMTLENFRDLSIAMLVAFLLIYAILVAQFQSFSAPGLIMVTVPLGLIGILIGFAFLDFLGIYLTATALIGFIALMGIVVNNAILYLEYFDQLRNESDISVTDALVEAGRTRLRPILLTSMTTVMGSLTIAADPVWSGLAWAIVFGLSLSAIMTLGIFPILYNVMQPKR